VTADIEFCVMQMPRRTMIVGLPDLIRMPRVNVLKPVESICIAKDDELPEWVKQDIEPCVEEEETADPCSFTEPLNYLSMPRDEALEEYEGLLESHISEDLLLSEKCK
jgi:hypothetical protein